MNSRTIIVLIVLLALIAAGTYFFLHPGTAGAPGQEATTTPVGQTQGQTTITPAGLSFTVNDPYGLALNPQQILTKSYIPSCADGFDYCIYRTGTQYADTNFESAGIAITQRTDLTTQTACLTTPPAGYTTMHATTSEQTGYATSVMGPTGDAAAGHYASGYAYRLWYGTTCYALDAQIGETQFANYPAGTKTEFSDADRAAVMTELTNILGTMQVQGMKLVFPQIGSTVSKG